MSVATLKLLTWATVAAAVLSALLLAALGTELPERGLLGAKSPAVASSRDATPRRAGEPPTPERPSR